MKKTLELHFPDLRISYNVPYSELTSLGIGGVAPIVAEPGSVSELAAVMKYLTRGHMPYFILGGGTNVVGMDGAYEGVILRLGTAFNTYRIEGDQVICGAMTRLPSLCRALAERGLGGISKLCGIPGTVGGAVAMNAGCFGVSFGNVVSWVSGVNSKGETFSLAGENIVWRYRGNDIPDDVVITEVGLTMQNSSPEVENAIISEVTTARRQREPEGRSAGCAFRNVSDFEPAGKLIDQCGLRGLRIGDVGVSLKHCNYLMNYGAASEAHYIELIRLVRRCVAEKFGFYLDLETVPVNSRFVELCKGDIPAPRVNVLCGGDSSEREVSLRSGAAVAEALRHGGFLVEVTDIKRCHIEKSMLNCDVVYPVLHGGFGENGDLQAVMERYLLKFVGSGSRASRLCMDKIATKRLLDELGIPTAKWGVITKDKRAVPQGLKFPLIIKAPCEGSSVGIAKVDSQEHWDEAVTRELKFAPELLVEECIDGVEITVPILNGEPMEIIEIRSPSGFYDYDAKYIYKNGHTEYICPPKSLSEEEHQRAKAAALLFYRASGCRDVLRVDFIVGKDGVPYVLEGNSIPGCTATSLVPKSAKVCGISFEKLTASQVYNAMKRPKSPVLEE